MSSNTRPSRTKGCFQCSKRRVSCDLGQPQCQKCVQKGLHCSGLGRIRFVPGVASRGKFRNSRIPVVPAFPKSLPAGSSNLDQLPSTEIPICRTVFEQPDDRTPIQSARRRVHHSYSSTLNEVSSGLYSQPYKVPGFVEKRSTSVQAWLPPVGHHARKLLSHCKTPLTSGLIFNHD